MIATVNRIVRYEGEYYRLVDGQSIDASWPEDLKRVLVQADLVEVPVEEEPEVDLILEFDPDAISFEETDEYTVGSSEDREEEE